MATNAKRSTIYFDPDLHKALKLKAVETSRSITELVNEAVRKALRERTVILRNPEVTHPAAQILSQLEQPVRHGNSPTPAGQFFQALFETAKRLISPADGGAFEGKTKKSDLVGQGHRAFLTVDGEFKRGGQLRTRRTASAPRHFVWI